jgi:chromosome partitioning protein
VSRDGVGGQCVRPADPCTTVVAGTKGGCGKTTTASNLLVSACLAGLDAVGIDLDWQGSLKTWAEDRTRAGREPNIRVTAGRLTDWRDAVATSAHLVVLDLAPGLEGQRDADALHELARAARLVLVPTLPEGPSVRKLGDIGSALRRTGGDVVFILNKVIAGRSILADARAYLKTRGELAPVEIPMRDTIHRAMDRGLTVVEEPSFGGCREYRELWRFVSERVGLAAVEAA